jgi:hypothetical protein
MTPSRSGGSLPRVMIKCPVIGDEIPTGFTAVSADQLERILREPMLVKCASCGLSHEWSRGDAFLRADPQ